MKFRWIIPITFLLSLRLSALEPDVAARITTVTINPNEVTTIHLRPEFVSVIRMPEEVTSVFLGSPGLFKEEHSEGETEYVLVKPITRAPAQSDLVINTKSGQHVTLELISDGAGAAGAGTPVDFLIEYRTSHSFLIAPSSEEAPVHPETGSEPKMSSGPKVPAALGSLSAIDVEYELQARVNAPNWTKWEGKEIETEVGDIRQWNNETAVAYSIFNASSRPVELVPPQIQISGRKLKKKKKEGKDVTADQLEVRDYRLSATRLEPGGRADGVVVFDRPNFKQSTEKLFLQVAQADRIDQPILIPLPFTPPLAGTRQQGDSRYEP